MNQSERRQYLIRELLKENPRYRKMQVPSDADDQKVLLRSLMNVRIPGTISESFTEIQDEYLNERNTERGIVSLSELAPIQKGLYLWRGDITTLSVDAIVNAANSGMTGCYQPCHNCIDNCIHTYAGVQLRNYCADLMEKQGYEEPTGQAKITPGFNLPCKYVIHTVGPIIYGCVTEEDETLLASCYKSCLEVAEENHVKSIAFCCISTGVFRFPNELAAEIAVKTVNEFKRQTGSRMKVIFNVFKEQDEEIYRRLLGRE